MKNATLSLLRPRSISLLAGIGLCTLATASAETGDVISKTLTAAPGGTLIVDVDVGAIHVTGAEGSQAVIEVDRKVRAGSKDDEERILRESKVTIDQSGDTITIRARTSKDSDVSGWWNQLFGGHRTSRNFNFKVTLPARYNVDLKTSGGGIDVTTLTGTVRVKTSGGGLAFEQIVGDIHGATSGGGIHLDRCRGDVDVNTSGGGIRSDGGEGRIVLNTSGGGITVRKHQGNVKASTSGGGITCDDIAGDVDAHTSGGPVNATLTQPPVGECRLSTSGGGVTVTLPANAAYQLDAETSGGGVHCDFPVTITGNRKSDRLVAPVNGGGVLVHLRSSGGGIHVIKGPASVAAVEH